MPKPNCSACGVEIHAMVQKGSGVCSQLCDDLIHGMIDKSEFERMRNNPQAFVAVGSEKESSEA